MRKTILLFTTLFVVVNTSEAQPGKLDSSFGKNGIVSKNFKSSTNTVFTAICIQSDGKIIAAGYAEVAGKYDFALARYNINGTPDDTFFGDGELTTDFASGNDNANAVAIQTDGKIIVAGYADIEGQNDFALARYNIDGTPDTSFSHDGKQTTDFDINDDIANAIAIQSSGKIVVAGSSGGSGKLNRVALACYRINGVLDSSFSKEGKLTDPGGSKATSLAIQSNGKIVVTYWPFAVARFHSDGTADSTFSGDGKQTTDFGNDDFANSVAFQKDGKIVAGGLTSYEGEVIKFAIARYNSDGVPDSTFSFDGLAIVTFAAYDEAKSVVIQSNGKIIAGGWSNGRVAIARLHTNGILDSSFGNNGTVVTHLSASGGINSLAISAGKLYAVGAEDPSLFHGIIASYFLEDEGFIPPKVSIRTPSNNTIFFAPANIQLKASASDEDGTISKVEFYNGSNLLYTATDTPYTYQWNKVPAGNYQLIAKATDDIGLVSTSDTIHISVKNNQLPVVIITSPSKNINVIEPGPVVLKADAIDQDGTIVSVDFYNDGNTLLFTDSAAPFSVSWFPVPTGSYHITAVATDNHGGKSISAPLHITVLHYRPPKVNITSPVDGTTYKAEGTGATIALSADATSHGGTIKSVDFYNGSNLMFTEYKAPFYREWQNVKAGEYTITAKATDNNGRAAISAPVTITVESQPANIRSSRLASANINAIVNDVVSIKLTPNPVRNVLSISTNGLQGSKQTISVISPTGLVVKTFQVGGSNETIKLNVLPLAVGVYILKMVNGDKVVYKQFVKL